MKPLQKIGLSLAFLVLNQSIAFAGAVPDRSLGRERSRLERGNVNGLPSEVVSGGARRGRALFHSFRRLSVADGQGLYFQSPDGIRNILTRVTGQDVSRINGVLGVLGGANLVLLNPNGIRFGNQARLDLGGSFLATTASSLNVGQFRFAAERPAAVPPLLTIDRPTGLNLNRSGSVVVRGTGHQIDFAGPAPDQLSNPIAGAGQSLTGLRVSPSRMLALIGGDVRLTGGVLSAPSGSVELGAVRAGQIKIDNRAAGWSFSYSPEVSLSNISLQQLSLIDASGFGGGRLRLTGNNVMLSNGSYGIIQNVGAVPSNEISIQANRLSITGSTAARGTQPARFSETLSGFVGNTFLTDGVEINAQIGGLRLENGGVIRSLTYGSGDGGGINIDSQGDVILSGLSPLNPATGVNVIQTLTFGSGRGGNISLNATNLHLSQGGNINAATTSALPNAGRGGRVTVQANNIGVSGLTAIFRLPSSISTTSVGFAPAGDLKVEASNQLSVRDGAAVGAITFGQGDAGEVQVRARSVSISSQDPAARFTGLYSSAAVSQDQFEDVFALPTSPLGSSGDLDVRADSIDIQGLSGLTVTNSGTQGRAGRLTVHANDISLNDNALITASTNGGTGGDIKLDVDRALELRRNASIDANANRRSRGGNVSIDSGTIALLDGSRIRANAQEGRGGRVSINARAIFISPNSAITATSERSPALDGPIAINALEEVGTRQGELELETSPELPQLSSVCESQASDTESQLIISGTGGLPSSPFDNFNGATGWVDPSALPAQPESVRLPDLNAPKPLPVEAQGWQRNPDGTLRLISVVPDSGLASAGAGGLNCGGNSPGDGSNGN